jgi:ABC-type branched-subunit amino acid transport system ATPase component
MTATGAPTAVDHPIVARNVSKHFGGLQVVKDFSIELTPGVATGLIGANGAGKTTIFNLLSGYLKPDVGEVFLHGEPAIGHSPQAIARMGIGRSFQEVRLFNSLTTLDNAALYAQSGVANSLVGAFLRPRASWKGGREAERVAMEALETVGLADTADVPAEDLSYADQKLLSIGRLLALGADTLLLDEPASGLDHGGVEIVVATVRRLTELGRTVLIIEHNLDVVRAVCDRIAFLDRGQVLAEGEPAEVFAKPELAEIYFGV